MTGDNLSGSYTSTTTASDSARSTIPIRTARHGRSARPQPGQLHDHDDRRQPHRLVYLDDEGVETATRSTDTNTDSPDTDDSTTTAEDSYTTTMTGDNLTGSYTSTTTDSNSSTLNGYQYRFARHGHKHDHSRGQLYHDDDRRQPHRLIRLDDDGVRQQHAHGYQYGLAATRTTARPQPRTAIPRR